MNNPIKLLPTDLIAVEVPEDANYKKCTEHSESFSSITS